MKRDARRRLVRMVALLPFAPLARAGEEVDAARHARFAARAIANRDRAVALGDQAYGAVLVCDDRVVADGFSAVVTRRDPKAHAEMEAIRLAQQRLGRRDLSGCSLYGSSRACAMCEAAAREAGLVHLYHGPRAEETRPRG
jgi:tRNA(Arg) A34 adenosine deaminase TadA